MKVIFMSLMGKIATWEVASPNANALSLEPHVSIKMQYIMFSNEYLKK